MLILLALIVAIAFAVAGLMGAPYVPILSRDRQAFFKLAQLKPGQTLIDLGSGDGALLRAAAARGIRSIGYELNPFMVIISSLLCWRYRRLITIRLGNLWHVKLPPADVIYVFLMPRFMTKLDSKLTTEIHHPTHVISYAFKIPGRQPTRQSSNTYVYEYGQKP